MSEAWLVRARWRRRGAWMWPAFVVLTAVDAVIGHLLPPSGDSQSVAGALMIGLVANLLGVILLCRPFGGLLRRVRGDLPWIVARDYAGTGVVATISVALLLAGLAHRGTITANERALREAVARAQAWIGDRAPDAYRRQVDKIDTFAIEPGSIYRSCVPSADAKRDYCVIVKTWMPFGRGVRFAGYEPNTVFAAGVG